MGSRDLVSIVLPTYNGARYLRRSIVSCLSQTHRQIELIVVNDGSTDDTQEILDSIDDRRLTIINHEENRGLPGALNTGLSAAQGAFLTWTSDDNSYMPQAIQVLLGELKKRSRTGCQLVYSNYLIMDELDNVFDRSELRPNERCVSHGNHVRACFLFTRRLFEETGLYDEELRGVEDYDYWLRAHRRFSFRRIRRALYYYRLHEGSITARSRESITRRDDRIRRRYLPCFRFERELGDNGSLASGSFHLAGPAVESSIDLTPETVREMFTRMKASGVILQPPLPRIGNSRNGSVTIDFMPTGSTVVLPVELLEVTGVEPDASAEVLLEKVFARGGSIAFRSDLPSPRTMRMWSWRFWFHLGRRMNGHDHHPTVEILRGMIRVLSGRQRPFRTLWYCLGLLAGKLPGLAHRLRLRFHV